jgi:hypothetical protein
VIMKIRLLPIALLLLPFTWMAVIAHNQVTFYPFTREVRIYWHEIELLYLLFAPFVFALPKHPLAVTNFAKRIYIWGCASAVFFYGTGTLLLLYSMSMGR